jgi:hypothetical protein
MDLGSFPDHSETIRGMQFLDLAPINRNGSGIIALERNGTAAGFHEMSNQLFAVCEDQDIGFFWRRLAI